MYDTIIIGAGMSGLAAGVRLAHYDRRVCIVERHGVPGGLNSFYQRRGRVFDVGLHALTNFRPKGARGGPLVRLLRQLRLAWDELGLAPQIGSVIAFPGVRLRFSNDFALLESEVAKHFPAEKDGFRRLVGSLLEYERFGQGDARVSARQVVAEHLRDPLLGEMLFCPILYYGGVKEQDIDFGLFSVLFRSIFLEGLARPLAGIRLLLERLIDKFRALGGELRLRAAVRRIVVREDRAEAVELADGSQIAARTILSSAGWPETLRLCDPAASDPTGGDGRLSFVESISILDAPPRALGHDRTMVFFNDSPRFDYRRPRELVDLRSGVVCSPNNFLYDRPMDDGVVRISMLANYDGWAALGPDAYRLAKLRWYDRMAASAARFVPDFRGAVVDTDMFTPLTIRRFTGHDGGAVYGAAEKRYDGTTHLKNLFLCGNDQGLVGIVGALLSGVSMANRWLLPMPTGEG